MSNRFWSKVNIAGPNECWEWTAGNDKGYGQYRVNSQFITGAHRYSFYLANGYYPIKGCACHTCDNRLCVNPAHLWDGNRADNAKDRHVKGRTFGGNRKLTEEQVCNIRKDTKSNIEIAKEYSISPGHVSQIINYRSWKNLRV